MIVTISSGRNSSITSPVIERSKLQLMDAFECYPPNTNIMFKNYTYLYIFKICCASSYEYQMHLTLK